MALTVGVGLTATVALNGAIGHPLAVAVILKVTVISAFVVFVNVPLISPLPPAAIPVTVPVLFLVHEYIVEEIFPANTIVVMALPEQAF